MANMDRGNKKLTINEIREFEGKYVLTFRLAID